MILKLQNLIPNRKQKSKLTLEIVCIINYPLIVTVSQTSSRIDKTLFREMILNANKLFFLEQQICW